MDPDLNGTDSYQGGAGSNDADTVGGDTPTVGDTVPIEEVPNNLEQQEVKEICENTDSDKNDLGVESTIVEPSEDDDQQLCDDSTVPEEMASEEIVEDQCEEAVNDTETDVAGDGSAENVVLREKHRSNSEEADRGRSTVCLEIGEMSDESMDNTLGRKSADASCEAFVGNTTVEEGYSFTGIRHIFDHHRGSVNRIVFAHNDASRLAMASEDGTISICKTLPSQSEKVFAILSGHLGPVTDLAWSIANDFILSCSTDCTARLWDVEQLTCSRVYEEKALGVGEVLACGFQPMNNNLFLVGGRRGVLQMMNLSTGKQVKGGRDSVEGWLTAIAFEPASGSCVWCGTSRGLILSYSCDFTTGQLTRRHKLIVTVNASPNAASIVPVTSIQARAWVSRKARDPCLLANAGALLFFSINSPDGLLILKNCFPTRHTTDRLHSCFCPLISFREGACVMTGSEDTGIYVFDVTVGCIDPHKPSNSARKKCVTVLQGHSASVLDVAISYDELVMASSDKDGIVILWKRINEC